MDCNVVEVGGVLDGKFKRYIYTNIKDVPKKLHMFNETDVYATIYRYDSKDQNASNIVAPLYIDMDIDDIENEFDKLLLDLRLVVNQLRNMFSLSDTDIQIYFSGSKGFHIVVDPKVFGFEPSFDLNEKLKLVALKLKTYTVTKCIDTKIYDRKRLFRVPNTINSKTGLYKVPIRLHTVLKMTYKDIVEYASKKHYATYFVKKTRAKSREKFDSFIEKEKEAEKKQIDTRAMKRFINEKKLLPCVEYLLQNGANQGNRNNLTIALASSLLQSGKTGDEVLDIVLMWNELKNEPALSDQEVTTTVNSAIKNFGHNRIYGCGSFKNMDMCLKTCPIHK